MTTATMASPASQGTGAAPPVISVTDLTRSYGQRPILRGLSFEVAPQEIFGILGANGAGKTTTVEIVQGLRGRDGGSVRVLGLDPAHDRASLRGSVGAQLQSSALPDRLRVGEALRLFAGLAGHVVDWRELRDEWGLTGLERSAFGSLSGGERQRLFIALALVNRPQVVFLDELTQGLDPAARRDTWRLVRRVRAQGATVVLVTHFMDEAEQLCDRLGVLHDGRFAAVGTPAELIAGGGGAARTRFSWANTADLAGLAALPGVGDVVHDGELVEVTGDAKSSVLVAAELARRDAVPSDFAVLRPSLEDVFVSITDGGAR